MKIIHSNFISFLAVVVVLVTFSARAGVFKLKKVFVPSGCYMPTISVAKFNDCTSRVVVNSASSASLLSPDDHVFQVGSAFSNPGLNCIGMGKICCITLEIDTSPCPANIPLGLTAQPQLSFPSEPNAYYRINSIFQKL